MAPRADAAGSLPGGRASEFHLAQIEDVHAGKTLIIDLWDPGDTRPSSASLQILMPTAGDYVPATFSWTASQGSTAPGAAGCDGFAGGTNVTSVSTTLAGAADETFNGCWLTISIQLPKDYDAPNPATDG